MVNIGVVYGCLARCYIIDLGEYNQLIRSHCTDTALSSSHTCSHAITSAVMHCLVWLTAGCMGEYVTAHNYCLCMLSKVIRLYSHATYVYLLLSYAHTMHGHTHTHTHVHTHAHAHTYIHTHVRTHTHTHMHTRTYTYTRTYTHVHTRTHTHTRTHNTHNPHTYLCTHTLTHVCSRLAMQW